MTQTEAKEQEEHGAIALTLKNEVNGRSNVELRVNPDWLMSKVKDKAYAKTKDEPRPTDRFTGQDENKVIAGNDLNKTFEQLTAPDGPLPGERRFFIRGPVGGA